MRSSCLLKKIYIAADALTLHVDKKNQNVLLLTILQMLQCRAILILTFLRNPYYAYSPLMINPLAKYPWSLWDSCVTERVDFSA